MDWELYFKNIILERGYDYYQMNAVEIINASNRSIDAKVIGSDAYDVRINFKNREIKSMQCSCPYDDYCKHLAAVLYYADNHPEIFPKNDDIDKLVKNVSLKDLREFLIEELANDKDLLNRFKVFTDSATDEDFYEKKLTYCFSKPVNVIRFIDEDMSFLIKNRNFELVLKLSGMIVDYLKKIYHCDYDAFIDILYKLDSIMIYLFNRNYEKPVLDFLGNIILTNDNIEILDMLTDTYSRIGDIEKLFNDNHSK